MSNPTPLALSLSTTMESLSSDLIELILSHLPIPSIVSSSSVCKHWHSITASPSFSSRISRKPWLFLYGQNNIYLKYNTAYAFDPESNSWIKLPPSLFPTPTESSFVGAGGYLFTTTSRYFTFSPLLKPVFQQTPPLRFPRLNPLIGVFNSSSSVSPWFIVVGGVRFIGGLVDIEDRLAVEIYNPNFNTWELCPPLPANFRSGNSSQSMSSALFRDKFYVFSMFSCFVSSFDLSEKMWSDVQTLRPPGVSFSFLVSGLNQLVLAGLCHVSRESPSFNLWKVDEVTMEYSEMSIMPFDLLNCLFDSEEDDKFASLKCVGLGNLVYVFNEEHHRNYPACVCEISSESGSCSWRKLPGLPEPVNRFHKVISFCSAIPLDRILGGEEEIVQPLAIY